MSSRPLVTVVVPAYNAERYIHQTIASVLVQTIEHIEVLVVDDGSTDATPHIVKAFADPRVRLLRNERGVRMSGAINTALASARADFVAHHDADDLSLPHRLEVQLRFLRAHPEVALVGAQAQVIGPSGEHLYAFNHPRTLHGIRWKLLFGSSFVHSSVMYRHNLIWQELGGYNQRYSRKLDFEFLSRVGRTYPVANLRQRLVQYREHPHSITSVPMSAADTSNRVDVVRENLNVILGLADPPQRWFDLLVSADLRLDRQLLEANLDLLDELLGRYVRRYPRAARQLDFWQAVVYPYVTQALGAPGAEGRPERGDRMRLVLRSVGQHPGLVLAFALDLGDRVRQAAKSRLRHQKLR
jgi:glycosyltransferase involved in cell wall biosynthesis